MDFEVIIAGCPVSQSRADLAPPLSAFRLRASRRRCPHGSPGGGGPGSLHFNLYRR
jgi:hypothetical protein